MTTCPDCNNRNGSPSCASCGGGGLSVDADNLDQLVQAASTPSLADLFRKAKQQGVIAPVSNYGGAAAGA